MAEYAPCDVTYLIDRLEREGQLLTAAAARAGLDAPVPACPDWRVRDLLAHTGYVHRWAAGYVAGQRTEPVQTPDEAGVLALAPAGESLVDWYAGSHAGLVRTLREAPPDVQCWSFLPASSPLAFWARRQAHETAIHRVDAEQAAAAAGQTGADGADDAVSPLPAGFAADGVDELLQGFLARSMRRGRWQGRPGALAIHADDGPAGEAGWLVATSAGESSVSRGTGPAECDVRGPAARLYLALWNREPASALEIRGEPGYLADIRDGLQVRW